MKQERKIAVRVALIVVFGALVGGGLAWLSHCHGGVCPMVASPWRGFLMGGLIGGLAATSQLPGKPRRGKQNHANF